ncbi:MAG: ribonuclease J [Patescibacteria group bacterium]|nr:ribonuclease J [Patescibacteria group bacterium]
MEKIQKIQNLRIMPLGGLGEIGKNMTLLEYDNAILIIDIGLRFPEENMPGIDCIVPNISYLHGKRKNIVGAVFTHGHYDHIGAIPYLIKKIGFDVPLYAGGLTKGIILKRQVDFPKLPKLKIEKIGDNSKIKLGPFKIEFFRQNHSISDNFGLFIKTPIGNIVHTSDFKFDENPVNELPTNFEKLRRISSEKVLLLMSDSTGAETEGHSLSEKKIIENLEKVFQESKGRIIASTFASLINRIQQLITLSEKYGRKIAIDGHSMKINVEICKHLGYIKFKKGTFIKTKDVQSYPDSKITIICTGAQGESNAVLMRIVNKGHRFIRFKEGDTAIFSSSVVPGNERTVQNLKDELYRQKVKVYHYKMMDIHTSGHAHKDELNQMLEIMKPKFFIPVHGQYSMLVNHTELAKNNGVLKENIAIIENGQVVNISPNKIFIEKERIPSNYIMVDGLGVGDVGEIVLRDRQTLAEDGMFVIIVVVDHRTGKIQNSPDIISRGFVYLRESKQLLFETRKKVVETINKAIGERESINWVYVKNNIRDNVGDFLYTKTERRPMILPVIIEV